MPIVSPCKSFGPQKTGRRAPATTEFETGIDACAPCSGPPSPNEVRADPHRDPVEHDRRDHLVRADRRLEDPGDAGIGSAERACRRRGRAVTCSHGTRCANDEPSHTAAYTPTRYWPWPPMLNIPQRNAKATARPVSTIGVVQQQRLLEVLRGDRGGVPREEDVGRRERDARRVVADVEEPRQPRAVEDRAVDAHRVLAGERDREPACEKRDERREQRYGDAADAGQPPHRRGLVAHRSATACGRASRRRPAQPCGRSHPRQRSASARTGGC